MARKTLNTLALILAGIALGVGCAKPAPREELLVRADTFLRDLKFKEAERTAKEYLLANPRDAGGHFLLGLAYMPAVAEDRHLVLAEGEFKTALYYFNESGKKNPIPRFESAKYFEIRCYLQLAKVYQLQFIFLVDANAPKSALQNRYDAWLEVHQAAKKVDPDWPDLSQNEAILSDAKSIIEDWPDEPESPDGPSVVPLEI